MLLEWRWTCPDPKLVGAEPWWRWFMCQEAHGVCYWCYTCHSAGRQKVCCSISQWYDVKQSKTWPLFGIWIFSQPKTEAVSLVSLPKKTKCLSSRSQFLAALSPSWIPWSDAIRTRWAAIVKQQNGAATWLGSDFQELLGGWHQSCPLVS